MTMTPREPIFILDSSIMKDIIEGKPTAEKTLLKLQNLKGKVKVITPLSSFLRAIVIAGPNTIVKNIQQLLNIVELYKDDTNYKNARDVKNKIIEFAKQTQGI